MTNYVCIQLSNDGIQCQTWSEYVPPVSVIDSLAITHAQAVEISMAISVALIVAYKFKLIASMIRR